VVIVDAGDGPELVPRAAAVKVRERDASMVLVDHAQATGPAAPASDDDAWYARFEVPDDLVW
jgi:uncharacterized protein YaiL (DUF2058 family)